MKKYAQQCLVALAFACLAMTAGRAAPLTGPVSPSDARSDVIQTAGASRCDSGCMATYDRCVETGLAAQKVQDDEVVYRRCSRRLQVCRNVCISQGQCITDETGGKTCP